MTVQVASIPSNALFIQSDYPRSDAQPSAKFQEPVWTNVHMELKKKSLTKQLLWEEYTQQYPNRCYSYSQFCARYAGWVKKQKPKFAYQYTDIKTARVNIDYHLIYDQHLYSVPHHCVGEQVELHAGDKLIEVYFYNNRIATHVRKYYPSISSGRQDG